MDDTGTPSTDADGGAARPFILLGKKGQANSMQLTYGEGPGDPAPFILIVTPSYVAEKTGKPSSTFKDVLEYVEAHAEELKTIAVHQRNRGYATEVLA